jgi:hypothetical protein
VSDDELPVTYRHDDESDMDVAVYDGQDIAAIEATESGALVAYGGVGEERTRAAGRRATTATLRIMGRRSGSTGAS